MIRIELAKTELAVGETLTGRAVWGADGGKQPRKIEVIVRWIMTGKGERRENVVDQASEADVGSKAQIVVPFSVEIPFGPVTYEGKVFTITYEVSATADLPFAKDPTETVPFIVRPAIWSPEQYESFLHVDDDDDEVDLEEDTDSEQV